MSAEKNENKQFDIQKLNKVSISVKEVPDWFKIMETVKTLGLKMKVLKSTKTAFNCLWIK